MADTVHHVAILSSSATKRPIGCSLVVISRRDMNRAGSNYINTQSGFMVAVGGISSPFSSVKLFRFRLLIWPYNQIVWASLLPLPATVGCCCHLFYYISQSKCLARWLAEASGHGDFLEYHTRFNHSQEAIKECPRGGVVSRSHFFSCPLTSFNNPLAGRLDPRAFRSSFQPFKSRASQVKLQGQAQDAPTGHPICNDPDRPPEMGSMVARLLD